MRPIEKIGIAGSGRAKLLGGSGGSGSPMSEIGSSRPKATRLKSERFSPMRPKPCDSVAGPGCKRSTASKDGSDLVMPETGRMSPEQAKLRINKNGPGDSESRVSS